MTSPKPPSKRKKKHFRIIKSNFNTIDIIEKENNIFLFSRSSTTTRNEQANDTHFQIASGSLDRKIKLWDAETCECLKTFEGHEWTVSCLVCLTNRQHIASGSWDRTVKLWNISTCQCFKTLSRSHGLC